MRGYILRRLLLAILTFLGVTVLIFVAMRILPGDPLQVMVGESGSYRFSEQELQAARASLGLDRSYLVQYLDWMGSVLRGELGKSFWKNEPIRDIVLRRAPITIQIAVEAVILSWLLGLPVGVIGAVWRGSAKDYLSRLLTILFMAIPSFWLGLMMILAVVLIFTWRPPLGIVYPWEDLAANLQMTIGPALALGIGLAATMARITRSSLLESMGQDYVRTARSKGLKERLVVGRHVLPNSMLPILTVSGVALGGLLGGSVAVERAFGVPGLGMALVTAISERDWMVIQNLVLLYGTVFVMVNLVVDVSYGLFDPRIRYR
jgi:peptide/nickel transport system permease protein